MPSVKQMRVEIRTAMGDLGDTMDQRVDVELDTLESSQGLNEKNNLEQLYEIWKSHTGDKGDQNKINSWSAYCLGMTSQKPDGDFMPVRRAFARAGFPDIDTDFDDAHRQQVFDYVVDKYGRGNVGNIGTYGVMKTKSCLTRIMKALDVAGAFSKGKDTYVKDNNAMVREVLDTFPKMLIAGKMQVNNEDGKREVVKSVEDAYRLLPQFRYYMDKFPGVMEHAKVIEGLVSNFSIHASGICISDIPLSRIAPLRTSREPGVLATQFAYEDLEEIGLIKFDILAIATLTCIRKTIESIRDNYGIDIDIEQLPLNDKKTLALYRSGELNGVFQCESYPMQKVLREIGVDRFEDIMAAIALFRPGPMDNIPSYCARKRGDEPIDYFHPSIEKHVKPILAETYGIGVFQEQIMHICNSLAGFDKTDGYVVIKGIGKKKADIINKFRMQFTEGCTKNDVPKDVAEQYWEKFITPFASYGFNKAHAAAYGLLSFCTAYLKANYPDEFACGFLNTEIFRSNHDKVEMMRVDAVKNLQIEFLSRNINDCDVGFKIIKKRDDSLGVRKTQIRPSLICKGVGQAAAENIVQNQPYRSLRDFATKTESKIIDKETLGALIDSGFFRRKGQDKKAEFIADFSNIRKDLKKAARKGVPSVDMFDNL